MSQSLYKILLVEDDKIDQMAFERLVEEENLPYYYEIAGSVSQARDILGDKDFDAIVCDYNLGDGTGFEVLEIAGQRPFIFVTGAGDEAVAVKAMKKGACDYLIKDPVRNYLKVLPLVVDSAVKNEAAARNLEKVHAQNQQLLDAIPLILIGVNSNYQITHWNRAAAETFAVEADDVLGGAFFDCGIKWDWNEMAGWITDYQRQDTFSTLENIRYQRPDGQSGYLSIKLSPFAVEGREPSGFLFLGEDITKRKMLENQLSQAQKLRSMGQLAAGLADEIKEPVDYLTESMQCLKELFGQHAKQTDSQDTSSEISSRLEQSAERVKEIERITQAMTVFAPDRNNQQQTIDINRTIESIIIISHSYWRETAEVLADLNPELPPVLSLPDAVNQIIFDLLINAADAIAQNTDEPGQKGTITINTSNGSGWVKIHITDTGGGIPEEIKGEIFEPFFTTKELSASMGQGLAICRSLADKIGGMLTLKTDPGKGTTFTLHLKTAAQLAEVN